MLARAPGFEEALLVVGVEPDEVIGRRLSDLRRRALARERSAPPEVETVDVPAPRRQPAIGSTARSRRAARRPRADAARARPRPARLRRQERLPRGRDRRLGQDRLGADGDRRRGAQAQARPLRLDAVRFSSEARAPTRSGSPTTAPISASFRSASSCRPSTARSQPRHRRGARPNRGEHPGPDPRCPPDGALEQVRLARRDDGQQVRAVGRIATLYGDMAGGFAPRCSRTCTRRTCSGSPSLNDQAGRELIPVTIIERAPSAELRPEPSSTRTRCRLSRARRRPEGVRRGGPVARGADDGRVRSGRRRAGLRADRPRGVQAPPGAARRQAAPEGVRARSAHADHESLARLSHSRSSRNQRNRSAYRTKPRSPARSTGARTGPCRRAAAVANPARAARRTPRRRASLPTNAIARRRSSPAGVEPLAAPDLAPRGGRPTHASSVRRVREAEAVLEEQALLGRRQQPRREARLVEESPEIVAGVREVRTRGSRDAAQLIPQKIGGEAGREHVRNGALGDRHCSGR